MSINRMLVVALGTATTLCASYKAQKVVADKMKAEDRSRDEIHAAQLLTAFTATLIIGGITDALTGKIFK